MRKLIMFVFALFSALCLSGAQKGTKIPNAYKKPIGGAEQIIYRGKTYLMREWPFSSYWIKHPEIVPGPPYIKDSDKPEYRHEKLPDGTEVVILLKDMSTGPTPRRIYNCTFEIVDKQLIVKDLQVREIDPYGDFTVPYPRKSILDEVFPTEEKARADWFTGVLTLIDGKVVELVHVREGPQRKYKHYILLKIENGKLVDQRRVTHAQMEDREEIREWSKQATNRADTSRSRKRDR